MTFDEYKATAADAPTAADTDASADAAASVETAASADAAPTADKEPAGMQGAGLLDGTLETHGATLYKIELDSDACTACGLCEAFCPVNVFEMGEDGPLVLRASDCWGCETCAGQCPSHALRVTPTPAGLAAQAKHEVAPPLPDDKKERYASWAQTLKEVLGLRWEPVAISLIPKGAPLPDVPVPEERMRYCQSLMAARRGRSIMMPANRHACPDGTSILGLTAMPAKLASGELYILFHKLDSIEAAQHMCLERPMLEPYTIDATVVTPLAKAACEPQVVAVVAQPEQMMWLCMSASYYTGHRHDLHASGYNAQCVETTLIPYLNKELNISFGCYGCRASSDVGDDLMMMGIPVELMPTVVRGLKELGKKAIPQSRAKIYLPPMM